METRPVCPSFTSQVPYPYLVPEQILNLVPVN